MTIAQLLHNPNAGDKEHSREALVKQLQAAGYDCRYSSTKEAGWDELSRDTDMIVIAGGDGTVRKVVKKMLQGQTIDIGLPIALMPQGTANNIAKTLGIPDEDDKAIQQWKQGSVRNLDAGRISGLKKESFFIESFGLGLFPRVIREMRKRKENKAGDPDARLQKALEVFLEQLQTYPAPGMYITADGKDYSGQYLLAEIMNTGSIGPRIRFNEKADPADGFFELVLIPETEKASFAAYLQARIAGKETKLQYPLIRARDITVRSAEVYYHADDEVLKVKDHRMVHIELMKGVLHFL